MHRTIAVIADLIFARRVTATADDLHRECVVVRTANDWSDALHHESPNLVLVDMECGAVSPADAIRSARDRWPTVRIVAFYPHVRRDLAEEAERAGVDDCLPRSVFVARLADILSFR